MAVKQSTWKVLSEPVPLLANSTGLNYHKGIFAHLRTVCFPPPLLLSPSSIPLAWILTVGLVSEKPF